MIRRASPYLAALVASSLLTPSIALATTVGTGGAGLKEGAATSSASAGAPTADESPLGTSSSPAPAPTMDVVQPGNATVTTSANGVALASSMSAMLYTQLQFRGSVPSLSAGATIELERLGHETGWAWAATASATAGAGRAFTITWRANHIGRFEFRAVVEGAAATAAASPALTVTVYRPSIATMYGPGLFGNHTACGEVLTPRTIGVANRTLPCGMRVAIYWGGHTIVVPVIDRGPYANHADWDLTEATARALQMPGMATIGAVSLPSPPPGATTS